ARGLVLRPGFLAPQRYPRELRAHRLGRLTGPAVRRVQNRSLKKPRRLVESGRHLGPAIRDRLYATGIGGIRHRLERLMALRLGVHARGWHLPPTFTGHVPTPPRYLPAALVSLLALALSIDR